MRSNSPVINVYKKNNIRSEVVTQILYGDTFKKIKKKEYGLKLKMIQIIIKALLKKKNLLQIKKILIRFII